MRTSTTIVEKLERWLASPGWGYYAMWIFAPMASPPLARLSDQSRPSPDRVR
jgi:hypothetical protein